MSLVDARAVIQADEFQFVILDVDGEAIEADPVAGNSLVSIYPDVPSVVVMTGAHWGPIDVAVAQRDEACEVGANWEDVVEISVRCRGALAVAELMDAAVLNVVDRPGKYRWCG